MNVDASNLQMIVEWSEDVGNWRVEVKTKHKKAIACNMNNDIELCARFHWIVTTQTNEQTTDKRKRKSSLQLIISLFSNWFQVGNYNLNYTHLLDGLSFYVPLPQNFIFKSFGDLMFMLLSAFGCLTPIMLQHAIRFANEWSTFCEHYVDHLSIPCIIFEWLWVGSACRIWFLDFMGFWSCCGCWSPCVKLSSLFLFFPSHVYSISCVWL